jgi:N,N'-diacetyllegionaminate synthase
MPTAGEIETAGVARKSLVYAGNLPEGTVLGEDDIMIKRPGTGLSPLRYFEILGKKIKRSVLKNGLVDPKDFTP